AERVHIISNNALRVPEYGFRVFSSFPHTGSSFLIELQPASPYKTASGRAAIVHIDKKIGEWKLFCMSASRLLASERAGQVEETTLRAWPRGSQANTSPYGCRTTCASHTTGCSRILPFHSRMSAQFGSSLKRRNTPGVPS